MDGDLLFLPAFAEYGMVGRRLFSSWTVGASAVSTRGRRRRFSFEIGTDAGFIRVIDSVLQKVGKDLTTTHMSGTTR